MTRRARGITSTSAVDRASKTDSQQPRFAAPDPRKNPSNFYSAVYRWIRDADLIEPDYAADSTRRDAWLRAFALREPYLAGVLSSVVSIDKNRGWSLLGGRNQVYRYTTALHGWQIAPSLTGWRPGMSAAAMSYYSSDLGTVVEIGRDGRNGPMRGMYHVDPTRCKLTGDMLYPLKYQPALGAEQTWRSGDFFRVTSLPSTDETFNGLGFCAVSRCLELAKIMVAIHMHDQEQLAARAPRGLLLLKGVSEQQWDDAMAARDARLDSREQKYYGAVAVLATAGVDELDAQLMALSSLPDNFDEKVFTDLLMYGYALAFGYDAREFWPVSGGALGTAMETDTQHRKATGKGAADFALGIQEQLQEELPETLQFEFDERDEEGELLAAQVAAAQIGNINDMYLGAGLTPGMIDREEARRLAAEAGIIPEEWTAAEEQVEATDVDDHKQGAEAEEGTEPVDEEERLLSIPAVRRACEAYPNEAIIRYTYPTGRAVTLFESGRAALSRRKSYPAAKIRAAAEDDVLYSADGVTITAADVEAAIKTGRKRLGEEYAQLLEGKAVDDNA